MPRDLERPNFYARVSQQKSSPDHISSNFDPGRSFNTIERSPGPRRSHQSHMNGGPGGSCQQERLPHRMQLSTQGGARSTKFNNRIPLPRPPYDVNRNTSLHHYLSEEYAITHRAESYLTPVPNSGSDIHFSDRSYNKRLSHPTSRSELREPPEDGFWRSAMMGPPLETPYSYSMPWGPTYHGPPMPMPMMSTPHHEAIQDDQDDIEIILGPEQEPSSAFSTSAGASEYGNSKLATLSMPAIH